MLGRHQPLAIFNHNRVYICTFPPDYIQHHRNIKLLQTPRANPAPSFEPLPGQQAPDHQSSHSSCCFLLAGAAALLPEAPLPIADVPIELPCGLRWSAADAKSSQNDFLLSSSGAFLGLVGPRPSEPSTNLLKPSDALRAPICAVCASLLPQPFAWAAKSDSPT